jgi:hypothetical protein
MVTAKSVLQNIIFQPDPDEPEAQILGPVTAERIILALVHNGFDIVDRRIRLQQPRRYKVSELKMRDMYDDEEIA